MRRSKSCPQIEAFLTQKKDECTKLAEGYAALERILGGGIGGNQT